MGGLARRGMQMRVRGDAWGSRSHLSGQARLGVGRDAGRVSEPDVWGHIQVSHLCNRRAGCPIAPLGGWATGPAPVRSLETYVTPALSSNRWQTDTLARPTPPSRSAQRRAMAARLHLTVVVLVPLESEVYVEVIRSTTVRRTGRHATEPPLFHNGVAKLTSARGHCKVRPAGNLPPPRSPNQVVWPGGTCHAPMWRH